jgi:hypothetical protein
LKNQGAAALTRKGVEQTFAGRGAISDAFNLAMQDLESAIGALSEKQRQKIFDEGRNFMAVEVVFPKTQNVIPYDTSMLIFHGIITYDDFGVPSGSVPEYAKTLSGMIAQANQSVQKTYTISAPSFLKVPAHQDFGVRQNYYINKVDALKNKFGLKDTDTVSVYHQAWWEDFVGKQAKKMKYPIPNTTLMPLVRRWAFADKSTPIADIKKMIGDKNAAFVSWVETFDKTEHESQVKKNMEPFESLFLELGAEILQNVSGFLAANPDKAVQTIRNSIASTIKQIRSGKNLKNLGKLKQQLDRVQALGGFEKIVPVEGLVFMYKGKIYKLTGVFAPVNQILGMIKYGE